MISRSSFCHFYISTNKKDVILSQIPKSLKKGSYNNDNTKGYNIETYMHDVKYRNFEVTCCRDFGKCLGNFIPNMTAHFLAEHMVTMEIVARFILNLIH